MSIRAAIFDLDGVIVSTDEFHFQAWKKISNEDGILFNREINQQLRGVSRMECIEIILENANKVYTSEEKRELAERKNRYYREMLNRLSKKNILPGVISLLTDLKNAGIKIGIGSSSKNARIILEKIGMDRFFDAITDGNEISHSKPDPEVFLLAAKKMRVIPEECVVFEDAQAGIEAANKAGMFSIGIGAVSDSGLGKINAKDLTLIKASDILNI